MAAPAIGDILVRTATGWKRLPPGTAGQALISGGAGVVPAWTSLIPGAGGLPYMYPYGDAIDWIGNDNFRTGDGAGGMDLSGTRFSGAQAWTAENIGAATIAVGDGRLWNTSPASASIQIRGHYQPVPSGTWCIRARFAMRLAAADTTEKAVGMYLRDSTTGKLEWFGLGYSGGLRILWANKMTNATTHSAVRTTASFALLPFAGCFFEIENDGTNYHYRWGFSDGTTYTFTNFAKTNFLGAAADGIGLFSENDQSIATTLLCEGFYRVPTSNVLYGPT